MFAPLSTVREPVYAITRIVVGALYAVHGAQKLFGMFGGTVQPINSLLGIAGVIETVCGLLVMVGLLGGLAAFIASGEMAFAYFMVHAPRALMPIHNEGELAAVFCFIFLFIAARGSGVWSLDGLIRWRRVPIAA